MKAVIKKIIAAIKPYWIAVVATLLTIVVAIVLLLTVPIKTLLGGLIFSMSMAGFGLCVAGLLYVARYLFIKGIDILQQNYEQHQSTDHLEAIAQKKLTHQRRAILHRALWQASRQHRLGLGWLSHKKQLYLLIDEDNQLPSMLAQSTFSPLHHQKLSPISLWDNGIRLLIVVNKIEHPQVLQLLALLRRRTYARQLEGILLTQPATALCTDNYQQTLLAQQKSLAVLCAHLKKPWQRTPPACYVLLTGLDAIEGFNDAFGYRAEDTLTSWLGILPTSESDHSNQRLLQQLQTQALDNIQHQPARTAARFSFIETLALLMQHLKADLVQNDTIQLPSFSGYFLTAHHAQSHRLYFFDGIFTQGLAQQAVISQKRRHLTRKKQLTVGLAGLIIACATLLTISFSNNQRRLQQVNLQLHAYEQQVLPSAEATPIIRLAKAMSITQVFNLSQDSWWLLHNGLYQGKRVNKALEKIYQSDLTLWLLPQLEAALKAELQTAVQQHSPQLAIILKAYLMLVKPQHFDPQLMKKVIQENLHTYLDADIITSPALMTVLDVMQTLGFAPLSQDTPLVQQAQAQLPDLTPVIFQALQDIAANKLGNAQSLPSVGRCALFITPQKKLTINPLYTQSGYQDFYRQYSHEIIIATLSQQWFYGIRPNDKQIVAHYQQTLNKAYATHYIATWRTLIQQMKIKPAYSLKEAISEIKTAEKTHAPTIRLLQWIDQQTHLATDKQDSDNPGLLIRQSFSAIHQWLAPSNKPAVRSLLKNITGIKQYLDKIYASNNPSQAALKQLSLDFKANQIPAYQKLQDQLKGVPAPLANWLQQLMTSSLEGALATAKIAVNVAWQHQVVSPFETIFASDFPFQPTAQTAISPAHFTLMFAPQGKLPIFMNQYIAPFIDLNQGKYNQLYGAHLALSPATVQLLTHFNAIAHGFFNEGKLQVNFTLAPVFLSSKTATVNVNLLNQSLIYRHGPAIAQAFQWPTTLAPTKTVLTWAPFQQKQQVTTTHGAWAWLRLLQQGKITPTADHHVWMLQFDNGDQNVQFKLEGGTAMHIIANKTLTQLSLPQQL